MTDHAAKQAAYAAKRASVTRTKPFQTIPIRLYLPDGSTVEGRWIGLSAAVAEHPDAWRVERIGREFGTDGGFF